MKKLEEWKFKYDLTKEEEKFIYSFGIKVVKKDCYRVAQSLCLLSKGKIKYCEGVVIFDDNYTIVSHSWNLYNNKLVDLIALNKNPLLCKLPTKYIGFELPYKEIKNKVYRKKYHDLIREETVKKLKESLDIWAKNKKWNEKK